MVIITNKSPREIKEIIEKNDNVIVDVFGEWCPPCKSLAQVLKSLSKKYKNLTIIKMDIDKVDVEMASKFLSFYNDVMELGYVPILFFFKKGKRLDKYLDDDEEKKGIFSGNAPMNVLEEILIAQDMI